MNPNTEDTVISGISPEKVKAAAESANGRKMHIPAFTKAQKVTVGGLTAVALLAGGTALAIPHFKKDDAEEALEPQDGQQEQAAAATENGTKIAEVSDDQSFAEAFSAARQAVGAGGVFQWHGNVYTTHTEQEWDSMTQQEQQSYTEAVSHDIQSAIETHEELAATAATQEEGTVEAYDAQDTQDDYVEKDMAAVHSVDDTADVRILGTSDIQMEDGSVVTVGEGVADDHDVYLVNIDGDQIYDVAVDDADQNGVVSSGETYNVEDDNLTADLGYNGADELVL